MVKKIGSTLSTYDINYVEVSNIFLIKYSSIRLLRHHQIIIIPAFANHKFTEFTFTKSIILCLTMPLQQ